MPHFESFADFHKKQLEDRMHEIVQSLDSKESLKKAMQYSLDAGGKRLRPLLLMAVLDAYGKDPKMGLDTACAIEMIHTYSLIHDDLPSMDDDDMRRGKLTNHKVYGEAMAILAGDGLLTLAFDVIASQADQQIDSELKLKLVIELARAAGAEGMVRGQVADMEGEKTGVDLAGLEDIHINKTGKLLGYSILAGAMLARAPEKDKQKFLDFSHHLGLAFQIRDDILDVEGIADKLGKPIGSDVSNQKSTYPSLLTMDGAKDKLVSHITSAREALLSIGCNHDLLIEIVELIANRDH